MPTTLNVPLKIALLESGRDQHEVAKLARIDTGRLSKIVRGKVTPNEGEKLRLAGVLQRSVDLLFPTEQVA